MGLLVMKRQKTKGDGEKKPLQASTKKLFQSTDSKNNTNISFFLKSTSDIQVDIYNAVGMHVKTIFSGKETAGVHNYDADCSDLNNGLYFVKINSGNERKTMMLSVAH